MTIPNFFMVGAPRCATTSMYSYLKQHPDVFLSLLKEPIFFGSDLTRQPLAVTDEASYRSLFEGAGGARVVGEGSVFYLMSQRAADEIRQFSPSAKILIMLRDPLDMMHSLHALYTRTRNEDLDDFEAAVAAQPDRLHGRRLPPRCYFPEGLQYTAMARYATQVERFVRAFGRERVHVIMFDDLMRDTAGEYRRLLAFLEVADHPAEFDVGKATERIRPIILRQMRAASPEIRRKLKTGDFHAGARGAPISPALRARLGAELLPDVERLSHVLDRDLTRWCRSAA
ncbi:MAG TPA: sulfotransferase [Kofleriaceae bacterium]|jgi:hypothetical protein|nr:sulfotransferase [Kofleriaceae bacterium]